MHESMILCALKKIQINKDNSLLVSVSFSKKQKTSKCLHWKQLDGECNDLFLVALVGWVGKCTAMRKCFWLYRGECFFIICTPSLAWQRHCIVLLVITLNLRTIWYPLIWWLKGPIGKIEWHLVLIKGRSCNFLLCNVNRSTFFIGLYVI